MEAEVGATRHEMVVQDPRGPSSRFLQPFRRGRPTSVSGVEALNYPKKIDWW